MLDSIRNYFVRRRKEALRNEMSMRRRQLHHEERDARSIAITNLLEKLPIFQKAQTILLYYPIGHEVDCSVILHRWHNKKVLLLPSVVEHHMEMHQYIGQEALKKGKFSIPEPTTEVWNGDVDLIIVPGVAFDNDKYRMGRGGGYYDRFLADMPGVPTIGIGYDFQIVEKLPIQRHDQKMYMVVTDKRIIVN